MRGILSMTLANFLRSCATCFTGAMSAGYLWRVTKVDLSGKSDSCRMSIGAVVSVISALILWKLLRGCAILWYCDETQTRNTKQGTMGVSTEDGWKCLLTMKRVGIDGLLWVLVMMGILTQLITNISSLERHARFSCDKPWLIVSKTIRSWELAGLAKCRASTHHCSKELTILTSAVVRNEQISSPTPIVRTDKTNNHAALSSLLQRCELKDPSSLLPTLAFASYYERRVYKGSENKYSV